MAKVLIADDSQSALIILKTILEAKGHEVVICRNGKEVLQRFPAIKPDIVLLDVQMPVMSGLKTCIELRKRPDSYNIPIAMISGHDSEEEIIDGLSAGADLYILKPVRADEVLSKVSLLLSRRGQALDSQMAENVIFASYYKVKSLLGRGGYSSVYLAEDTRDGSKVALKILDSKHTKPRYVSQFLREAYELSLLHHPNIVSLLHFGNFGEKYFLVTEFIEGDSLETLSRQNPIQEQFALDIAEKMCEALKYLHKNSIIHRDIKPGNILISPDDRIVLVDFGLAKEVSQHTLSLEGEMQGTPHILAPEYIRNEPLTSKVDLYALGVSLFYAMSARYPFNNHDPIAVIQAHLKEKPPLLHAINPMVSIPFSTMVSRMLAKTPQERCSLKELSEMIKTCRDVLRNGEDQLIPPLPSSEGTRQPEFDYHCYPEPGKISLSASKSLDSLDDLSHAIADGTRTICKSILEDPEKVWDFTSKGNLAAIVSDGSNLYDFESSTPEAVIPALEGQAAILKKFADLNAIPIVLSSKDFPAELQAKVEEMATLIARSTLSFGLINLSFMGANLGFELEERLQQRVSVPVYFDCFHSTAIALIGVTLHLNALKITSLKKQRFFFNDLNAYTYAILKLLKACGVNKSDIHMFQVDNPAFPDLGDLASFISHNDYADIIRGSNIFVDFSGNMMFLKETLKLMSGNSTILSLTKASSFYADEAQGLIVGFDIAYHKVLSSLITPGFLRGVLDARIPVITDNLKLAVASMFADILEDFNAQMDFAINEEPTDSAIQDTNETETATFSQVKSFQLPTVFHPCLVALIAKTVVKTAIADHQTFWNPDSLDEYFHGVQSRTRIEE